VPDVFETAIFMLERESFVGDLLDSAVPENDFDIDVEGTGCSICNDSFSDDTNMIVFCDGCDVGVHQACYGIRCIPEGMWFCQRCEAQQRLTTVDSSAKFEPTCVLCSQQRGAMMAMFEEADEEADDAVEDRTVNPAVQLSVEGDTIDDPLRYLESYNRTREPSWDPRKHKWAHCICALWVPEVRFLADSVTEVRLGVVGVSRIPKERWELKCELCGNNGACIQCNRLSSCAIAFHPTCSRKAALQLEMREKPGTGRVVALMSCSKHSPARKPRVANVLAETRFKARPHDNDTESRTATRSPISSPKPGKRTKFLDVYSHQLCSLQEATRLLATPATARRRAPGAERDLRGPAPVSLDASTASQIWEHWKGKRESRSGHPLVKRFLKTLLLSSRALPLPAQEEYETVWNHVHGHFRSTLTRWRKQIPSGSLERPLTSQEQSDFNTVSAELLNVLQQQNYIAELVKNEEREPGNTSGQPSETDATLHELIRIHPKNAALTALASAKQPLVYFDELHHRVTENCYSSIGALFYDINALTARALRHFESYTPEHFRANTLRLWSAELHRQFSLSDTAFLAQWVTPPVTPSFAELTRGSSVHKASSSSSSSSSGGRRKPRQSGGDEYDPAKWPSKGLKSDFAKNLDGMLRRLWSMDRFNTFKFAVDPNVVPEYSEVIKTPMYFELIRQKIQGSDNEPAYANMRAFQTDVRLVAENAKEFNAPGSRFYKQAIRLEHAFLVMCKLEAGDLNAAGAASAPHRFSHRPHMSECLACQRVMRGRPPIGGLCWLCEPSKSCSRCQTHETVPVEQITPPGDGGNSELSLRWCAGCEQAFHKKCLSREEASSLTIAAAVAPKQEKPNDVDFGELHSKSAWCCSACTSVVKRIVTSSAKSRRNPSTSRPRVPRTPARIATTPRDALLSSERVKTLSPALKVKAILGKANGTLLVSSSRPSERPSSPSTPAGTACEHHRRRKRRCPEDCKNRSQGGPVLKKPLIQNAGSHVLLAQTVKQVPLTAFYGKQARP
jgi:PHD-zinc-finger like domain/Bromodomain/PHD-finger